MIKLKIYEAQTFYSGPGDELEKLFECLRVADKNSKFRSRWLLRKMGFYKKPKDPERLEEYEQIREDTKWIKFYDNRRKCFGTGLLGWVRFYLQESGVDYRKKDYRNKRVKFEGSEIRFAFRDKVEAREEQEKSFKAALKSGCGILHLATNAGKTEIAAMIISAWKLKTGHLPRTLFLIHRTGLAEQTRDRFRVHLGHEERIQSIGGGGRKLARITIATTQTASRLAKKKSAAFSEFLAGCDILFVDELHVNKAKQLRYITDRCRARMRFGLSGTIKKENPVKMMHFMGIVGPIIAEIRNKELVEKGRSAKPTIRMVRVAADTIEGGFMESYREAIVDHHYRNRLVLREAFRYVNKGYRTFITVARINHGKYLRDKIRQKVDIPVEYMDGHTPLYVRKELKRKFAKGKLPILIASPIFNVGEDLPEIDAWVNAAGGKGWELVIQRLGRTLRKKEGENKIRITDFIDLHNPYMLNHSVTRLGYYLDEEIAKIKIL